ETGEARQEHQRGGEEDLQELSAEAEVIDLNGRRASYATSGGGYRASTNDCDAPRADRRGRDRTRAVCAARYAAGKGRREVRAAGREGSPGQRKRERDAESHRLR